MQNEEIIKKTAEYILALPDGSALSMYEAIQRACPEENIDIRDSALFDLHSATIEVVEKTGCVLDFSAYDDAAVGLPYHLEFIVRQKRLQKAQLISDLVCYGPCPEPEDAIEQRLTISSNGHVWFTEYLFGEVGCQKPPLGRCERIFIGKEKAAAILSLVADYCESGVTGQFCTDIGSWYLTATSVDGTKQLRSCSLCGGILVGDVDLTDYIQEQIPIRGMAVFGGGKGE